MTIAAQVCRKIGRRRSVPCMICLVFFGPGLGNAQQRLPGVQAALASDDPRLTFATPHRNVRPGIKYVGDAVCSQCHPGQAETYRQHPMGRSFAPVSDLLAQEHLEKEAHNPFEASGYQFSVLRREKHLLQKIQRRMSDGRLVCETEAEIQFAIGAGSRGRSYVINHDGYLFQAPISWFAETKVWDLSPHLAGSPEQLYRPIQAACLFCHCNHAEPVEHTGNRYRPPIFRGQAIGCERCHGPGELHVAHREKGEAGPDVDHLIVNPGRLAPALRESVCQQCHLQGVARVLPRGRQPFDYRPGLPLHLFWSVFVRAPEQNEQLKFSSHVEQMVKSKCYQRSNRKLGCVSCHDPHALPEPAKRIASYRSRCLNCHTEKSCALESARRLAKEPSDSCIACHMPRAENSNIAHMSSTDHRILRRADSGRAESIPGTQNRLVLFHQDLADHQDQEVQRDLGVALMDLAALRQPMSKRSEMARAALPLLEKAVHASPADVPAWQANGYALWLQDRKEEALKAFETALARAPQREEALMYAAAVSAQLGRDEAAMTYWQRAVAVNPWSARCRVELAKLMIRQREWPKAVEQCQAALRLNPFQWEPRLLLVRSYLQSQDKERACAEFGLLLELNPPQPEALKRWFAEQTR